MTKFRIFTWNFGKLDSSYETSLKLKCISEKMGLPTRDTLNDPMDTIYVIGLQEVSKEDIEVDIANRGGIFTYFAKQKPENYRLTYGHKTSSGGFDLLTIILYPQKIGIQKIGILKLDFGSISIPSTSSKGWGIKSGIQNTLVDTKGYLYVDFSIDGIEYTIVNIHLPFEDEAFSLKNFQKLIETFGKWQTKPWDQNIDRKSVV